MAIFSILTHPSLITPLLPPNHPFQGQSSKIKLAHTSSHPILSSAYFPRGSMPTLSQNLLLSSSPVTSVLPNPLDSLPSQSFSDSLGIFDPVDPSFLKECPPLVWGTSHTLSVFFSFPLSRHHAGPFPGSFYLLPAVYAILRPPFFLTNTTPALFRSANSPAKKTRFSGLTWSWEDMYSDQWRSWLRKGFQDSFHFLIKRRGLALCPSCFLPGLWSCAQRYSCHLVTMKSQARG